MNSSRGSYLSLSCDYDVVLPYKVAKAGPYARVLRSRFSVFHCKETGLMCLAFFVREFFISCWLNVNLSRNLRGESHMINPLFDSIARNNARNE